MPPKPIAQRLIIPTGRGRSDMGEDRNAPARQAAAIQRATDAAARIAARKANPQAQNQPGSGVLSIDAYNRPSSLDALNVRMSSRDFTPRVIGGVTQGSTGIVAPPALGNSAPQSVTLARRIDARSAANPRPTGDVSAAAWQGIQARNAAIYRPSATITASPQQTTPGITSRAVPQAESDAILGAEPSLAMTGATQWTPFGPISSRTASPGETAAIPAPLSPTGVVHPQASDPVANAQARIALQQQHPKIFQKNPDGTPTQEAQAFGAYAREHGEAEAHRNAAALMATLSPQVTGAPVTAVAKPRDPLLVDARR